MSRTYAVADLHGRFDLLEAALGAIQADATEPGLVVFTGDYVDRGPQSREVVERLIAGPAGGWTWICLKGNHEEMMATCLRGQKPMSWWLGNGGAQTMISYGLRAGDFADPAVVPGEHLAWIDGLPLMHVDAHRVFVHAGIDPQSPLELQTERDLLWKRYEPGARGGHGARHVVHGHTPHEDGPLLVEGRTNLDTLAWLTGRLVVAVFEDDMPGGPQRFLEVLRKPA